MRAGQGLRSYLCIAVAALFLLAPTAAAASQPTYTRAPGSPLTSPSNGGSGLAFSPNGALLARGTAIFSVSASGALTPAGATPPDPSARSVSFSPSGTLLAAPNEGSDTVSMFSVSSSGGLAAVPGSPFTLGAQPTSAVFSPGGELLAVSAGESLYMFSVSGSGVLTPAGGSPYSVKGTGQAAFSPSGGLLAVPATAGVSMFSVGSSGVLTQVPGSPFAASGAPGADAAFSGGGSVLRVAGIAASGELVTSYSVASSGVPTPTGSGTIIPPSFNGVAFSPDGSQIATTGVDNSQVYLNSIGPSGALSPVQTLENPDP